MHTEWAEARSIPVPETGCWIWLGAEKGNGYGNVRCGGKNETAHRRSYREAFGDIPDGSDVCHKCDTRLCINPDHLFTGSRLENMADCFRKGRTAKGSKLPQTKVSDEDRLRIRTELQHMTGAAISKIYGICAQQANRIKRGV